MIYTPFTEDNAVFQDSMPLSIIADNSWKLRLTFSYPLKGKIDFLSRRYSIISNLSIWFSSSKYDARKSFTNLKILLESMNPDTILETGRKFDDINPLQWYGFLNYFIEYSSSDKVESILADLKEEEYNAIKVTLLLKRIAEEERKINLFF